MGSSLSHKVWRSVEAPGLRAHLASQEPFLIPAMKPRLTQQLLPVMQTRHVAHNGKCERICKLSHTRKCRTNFLLQSEYFTG